MKIRMLTSQHGAEDGVNVVRYLAGEEYDLGHSAGAKALAEVFVREKWAEPAELRMKIEAPEIEARGRAPENKARRRFG